MRGPDQPDAGLTPVGGEDPGERAVAEVELVAVPGHVAHVGVEAGAGGRVSLRGPVRPRAGRSASGRRPLRRRGRRARGGGARRRRPSRRRRRLRTCPAGHGGRWCGPTRSPRLHGRPQQDVVQHVAARCDQQVDPCLVARSGAGGVRSRRRTAGRSPTGRRGAPLASTSSRRPQRASCTTPAPHQRVGRGGVARQARPVDQEDVVAGSGEQERGRGTRAAGADDHHGVPGRVDGMSGRARAEQGCHREFLGSGRSDPATVGRRSRGRLGRSSPCSGPTDPREPSPPGGRSSPRSMVQHTAVPSRATTPSSRTTRVASVVIGLSSRTEVTSTSPVMTSPGRVGARKRQCVSRKTVPGPGRRSATTALRMALVTPPWTTIPPKLVRAAATAS